MRKRDENKKKAIIDAAIKVFAENGFHQAKVSQIAELAGVAAGSTYLYFKSKEDLLHYIFEDLWQRLQQKFLTIVEQSDLQPIKKLEMMIDTLIDMLAANPAAGIVIVNELNRLIQEKKGDFIEYYEQTMDIVEKAVIEGVKGKHFYQKLDTKIFRYFLMGGIRQLIHRWASDPESIDLDQIRSGIKYLIKYGILDKSGNVGV